MDDLKSLSLNELKKLQERVTKELSKRSADTKSLLLKRVEKMAKEHGLQLSDVLHSPHRPKLTRKPNAPGHRTGRPDRPAKLPIKYWNPLNPNEGWSGHARRPEWFKNWVDNGGDPEDLKRKRT